MLFARFPPRILVIAALAAAAACVAANPSYVPTEQPDGAGVPPGDVRGPETGPDVLPADASAERPPADAGAYSGQLVGYWRFEDGRGRTVTDSSSNHNHGTIEGLDPAAAWVSGRPGQGMAIEFPSQAPNTSGIRVPLSPSITAIRRFTIAAWIRRPGFITMLNASVLSRQHGTGTREIYNLSAYDQTLVIWAATDPPPSPEVRVPGASPINVWHHVAATYDGMNLRLYRDGQQVGVTPLTRTLPDDSTPLYIGTNKSSTRNEVFWGTIDEVALFSVALPPAAIAALASGTPADGL